MIRAYRGNYIPVWADKLVEKPKGFFWFLSRSESIPVDAERFARISWVEHKPSFNGWVYRIRTCQSSTH